jgi:hypothetical protein
MAARAELTAPLPKAAASAALTKSGPQAPAAIMARTARMAAMASVAGLANRPIAANADQTPQAGRLPPSPAGMRIAARIDAGPSASLIARAQGDAARSPSLDLVQESAKYQRDVSPSDASPGASAQAASVSMAAVIGPLLRSTNPGIMPAKGPTRITALDAPPLKLKSAVMRGALGAGTRR